MLRPSYTTITSMISPQPSATVKRAAETAASSQHAYINLVRLVGSLDRSDVTSPDEQDDVTRAASFRKEWEVSGLDWPGPFWLISLSA
jgi:hypothetical protein